MTTNSINAAKYHYYSKDHLGNVRSVVTKSPFTNAVTEEQKTHYYPFGGIIADLSTGRSVQNRLYNGKELDTSNNLWWYDCGARQYDPTRGQFSNYDQHCENYYSTNPLTYCENSPIMRFAPTGMDWYENEDKSAAFWQEGSDETITRDDIEFRNVGSSYKIYYSWGDISYNQYNINNIEEYMTNASEENYSISYSSFFSNASTLTSEYAKWRYNADPVTGGYWRGANGKLYNASLLQKQATGKYVRGVQGYRYSVQYAFNRSKKINNIGNGLGIVSIGVSIGQYMYENNEENAWNIVDNIFSAINPILNTVGSVLLTPLYYEQKAFNQDDGIR